MSTDDPYNLTRPPEKWVGYRYHQLIPATDGDEAAPPIIGEWDDDAEMWMLNDGVVAAPERLRTIHRYRWWGPIHLPCTNRNFSDDFEQVYHDDQVDTVLIQSYGWTIATDGHIHGLVAGDMGYDSLEVELNALIRDATLKTGDKDGRISDALGELVKLCMAIVRNET